MSEAQYQVGDKVKWQDRECKIISVNDDKGVYKRPPYTIEFDMVSINAKGQTSVFSHHIEPIKDSEE